MNMKSVRKFLAVSLMGSMFFAGAGSLCASASNKEANIPIEKTGLQQNDQEDQESLYLQNNNIEKSKYDEFLVLSELNFDEMKNILETHKDINFDYIYKLSAITKNYWAHYKQMSLTKREIFLQALYVAEALHLECLEVDHLEKLLEVNTISLHDMDVFIRKGFSEEQKKNLSVRDLACWILKVAAEAYTDFFRDDFKAKGYSSYGVCACLMERTGWTFDQITNFLENKTGIHGLELIAKCCEEDKNLNFSEVVEQFKNYDSIKIDDVCYLYREIVSKRGLSFKDLAEVVKLSEGFKLRDFVDLAESAKKSGRTFLEEFDHKYP